MAQIEFKNILSEIRGAKTTILSDTMDSINCKSFTYRKI